MSGYLLAPICFGLGVTYYALMRKDLQLQEQNRIEYAQYISHILKDTQNPSDEGQDGDDENEKEEKEQELGTGDQGDIHGNTGDTDAINSTLLLEHVFNVKTERKDNRYDSSPNSLTNAHSQVHTNLHSRALRSRSLHNINQPLKSSVSHSLEKEEGEEENIEDIYGFPLKSSKVSQDNLKPLSVSNTYLKTKLEHLIWEDRKDGLNIADSKLKVHEDKNKEEVKNVVSRILLKGKDSSIERISAATCTTTFTTTASKEDSPSSSSTSSTSFRRQFSGHPRINNLFTIPVPVTPWRPKLPTVYQTNMALIQYDLPLPSSLSQTQELKQATNETPLIIAPIKILPPKPETKSKLSLVTNDSIHPPPLPPRCPTTTTRILKSINNDITSNSIQDEICTEVYENFKYLDVDSNSIQINNQDYQDEPVDFPKLVKLENEENCSDVLKSNIIIDNSAGCDEKNGDDSEIGIETETETETETDRKTSSTITVIHNPPENSSNDTSNPRNSCTKDENLSTLENIKELDLLEDGPQPIPQDQDNNESREETEENIFYENDPSLSFENPSENEDNNNNNIENLRNNSQPDSTHFLFSPTSPNLKSDSVISLCLQNPIMDSFSSSFIEFSTENEIQVDENISISINKNEDTTIIISDNNNNDDFSMNVNKREEKSPSTRLDYLHLHEFCVKDILQEIQSKRSSSSKIGLNLNGIKRTQSLPHILNSKDFQPDWHTHKITENIGICEQFYHQIVSFITNQWPSFTPSHYAAWLKGIKPTEIFNSININTFSHLVAASVLVAFLVIIFSWIMTSFSNPNVETHSTKSSSWHW